MKAGAGKGKRGTRKFLVLSLQETKPTRLYKYAHRYTCVQFSIYIINFNLFSIANYSLLLLFLGSEGLIRNATILTEHLLLPRGCRDRVTRQTEGLTRAVSAVNLQGRFTDPFQLPALHAQKKRLKTPARRRSRPVDASTWTRARLMP